MPYPALDLYPATSGLYPEAEEAFALPIRNFPPLRLHIDAITPNGRHYRWGLDEPNPANVPRDLRLSTSMPGGFDSFDVTLPRKPGTDYSDLDRLSTLRVIGAGGEVAGEYRLERAPRTSGNEMSVSPGAVGWQAHLEDDKSASEVYVDIDLSHWEGPHVQRKLNLIAASIAPQDGSSVPDATTGQPSLETAFEAPWAAAALPQAESVYDAGSGFIGSIYYGWKKSSTVDNADGNWGWYCIASTDDLQTSADSSGNLRAAGPGSGVLTTTSQNKRFGMVQHVYTTGPVTVDARRYSIFWTSLAVVGNHGLAVRGTQTATSAGGLYASDVIGHAVGSWAPLLNFTTGSNGTIQPSSFVIPQLEFREHTTTAEIVKQANRFHLRDWAVWEDKTFHYHDRGAIGRRWRARIAPAQLSETGPQVDRLWNGVIVKFNDVDGTSKTVGPVGSGADTETAALEDDDPENPVNQLGIRRWTLLDMGGVSTVAGATQVGQIFMEQSKLLDSSGQAQLVGVVEDDRGIQRPAWQVRAGDYITFVDAADSSARRIVKTDYSHDTRTCSIDLDAPPEGMDALLERLGVVLQPLGL